MPSGKISKNLKIDKAEYFKTALHYFFLQGNQIFLFGGTSPHNGPKIAFTVQQQQFMPDQQNNLIDHNDVFVLDLKPSLRTLCLSFVINHRDFYNLKELPASLRHDIDYMTKDNEISEPLRYSTLPLG